MAARLRLADLLGGLSLVADLGFGLPPQTALRSCLVSTALARRLGLPEHDVRDCFYTGLLMHIGCLSVAHEAAASFGDDLAFYRALARTNVGDPADVEITLIPELTRGMTPTATRRARHFALHHGEAWARVVDVGVCEVARHTAARLGLAESTQLALHHVYEAWAGGWVPAGLAGEEIPIAARVARVATEAVVFNDLGGPDAARAALQQRAGILLDPNVTAAFALDPAGILAEATTGDPRERILEVEPTPVLERDGSQLTEVAAAFGDLVDLKTPFLHGHARATAQLAAGAARRLGMGEGEVRESELAGLLHDIGRSGVSNAVWEKPGAFTRGDWEQVRMHAYFSERILATSGTLEPLAPIVGMHHERLDGSGYHRSVTAGAIPMTTRIVAAADAFSAMVEDRPHRSALAPDRAAAQLSSDAAAGRLDHDAVGAVLTEAGHEVSARRTRPAGLSEREVEVLVLLAEGCSNPQIAERLYISRRTAEHHAQHIYAKLGVSSRPAAALFAVEHGLLAR